MAYEFVLIASAPDSDGGVTVRLIGDVAGADAVELERRLRLLVDQGHTRLQLDFGRVSRVEAAAFGRLARLHVDLLQRGGALTLVDLPADVRQLLDASGRAGVFQIEG
ncbi:MAG: STAS domain-containing protein [Actinomycetota bacterium]|nr:STAS domain-containing protein [Actinomycetota bacterium]